MPYTLDNAETRHAQFPASFYLPSAVARGSLRTGDAVKLIFLLPRKIDGCEGERMWVLVCRKDDDEYTGTLLNSPAFAPELGVSEGDVVRFRAEHVADIDRQAS